MAGQRKRAADKREALAASVVVLTQCMHACRSWVHGPAHLSRTSFTSLLHGSRQTTGPASSCRGASTRGVHACGPLNLHVCFESLPMMVGDPKFDGVLCHCFTHGAHAPSRPLAALRSSEGSYAWPPRPSRKANVLTGGSCPQGGQTASRTVRQSRVRLRPVSQLTFRSC